MEGWIQVLIIIGIYCAIVLAVGVFSRDKGKMSLENYFVGNRSIGPFVAYFTYVATFHSSFAFLGAAGKLYSSGIDFFAFQRDNQVLFHGNVGFALCFG